MSVRRTRKIGGRKLGHGVQGDVYTPPLECASGSNARWHGEGYVAKLMDAEEARNEYKNSFLIRQLDPDGMWSIHAEQACEISSSQPNANYTNSPEKRTQLIFRNGGKSLLDYLIQNGGDSDKLVFYLQGIDEGGDPDPQAFDYLNYSHLGTILSVVKRLLPALDILNSQYTHNDLHLGNIVYDGHTPRLIDFSSLAPVEKSISFEMGHWTELGISKLAKGHPWQEYLISEATADKIRSNDVAHLFKSIYMILASKWIRDVSSGRFRGWVDRYSNWVEKLHFRSDFKIAIMELPDL